jgi:hypothetical protein
MQILNMNSSQKGEAYGEKSKQRRQTSDMAEYGC